MTNYGSKQMTKTKTPKSLWTDIQEYTKEHINPFWYRNVVEKAKAVKIEDDVLIVQVVDELGMRWMEERLTQRVENYLLGIPGVTKVEFVKG